MKRKKELLLVFLSLDIFSNYISINLLIDGVRPQVVVEANGKVYRYMSLKNFT